jgi:hypothetical protein
VAANNGQVSMPFDPVLVEAGPLLDWFPGRFLTLPWVVPAGQFAPGVPHRDMPPRVLERFVLRVATYEQRDAIWAGIVVNARNTTVYRTVALGLAAKGLRGARNRIPVRNQLELADIDADLAYGLLRRLATIDITRRNIAGRLVDSGAKYAIRQWRKHLGRPLAVDPDAYAAPSALRGAQASLDAYARALATTGRPLDPADVELIALTRIDQCTIIEAAAQLAIPVEAAYKRRQRAEARIRALIVSGSTLDCPAPRRRPLATTAGHATAAAASAGSATRQTAAVPAPR